MFSLYFLNINIYMGGNTNMLIQALLIAIWAGIAGIDLFDGLLHIHRPIVTGLVIGLILGDVNTGLITGATLEMVWMGMVPLAGAQPPNVVIGGVIGTSFAILTKQSPSVAVGIAVPFAVAVQGAITLIFTVFSPIMHKADKYAEEANTTGIDKINYFGMLFLFVFYFIIAFLPIYLGADAAKSIVQVLPPWFIGGLSVAGGMMPAIGFAMLLKIMLKKEYIAFLMLGFIFVSYGKLQILPIALIGTAIALYDFFANKNKTENGSKGEVRLLVESNLNVNETKYNDKVITKKDLNRMVWRSLFLQASFNYERMQACGWLYSLLPGLKKIHKDKANLSEAMKDHMEFFNTHPFLVTFIMGIVTAMEESKQDRSTIRAIKVATMGPLGGIGDALCWLTALPICLGIGISMAMEGNAAGPIIFLILFNAIHFSLRFGLMHYGYNTGTKAIKALKENTKKVAHAASIVGLTVIGGLIGSYINFKTTLVITAGKAKVALQADVFDKILLNLLPLAYVFLMYHLLKKGLSPLKLIGITIAFGLIGRLIGIV